MIKKIYLHRNIYQETEDFLENHKVEPLPEKEIKKAVRRAKKYLKTGKY